MSFIDRLPEKLYTQTGNNPLLFSNRLKQLISIARILYREPEILLFDEGTLFLDTESEFYVQLALQKLKEKGKTIIYVPSRLSSTVYADQIVVLKKGKVLEEGSIEELFRQKGWYYQKWKSLKLGSAERCKF